jgi:hypothetical protein
MDTGRERRALRLPYVWTRRDRLVALGAVVLALLTLALLVKGP